MKRKVKPREFAPKVKVKSMDVPKVMRHAALAVLAASLLSSCAAWESVKNIGQPPPLSAEIGRAHV